MSNCIFCKIINHEIPAEKVYEDNSSLIFHDLNPEAPIHYLAIPKKHYAGIHEIPPSEMSIISSLFSAISKVVTSEHLTDNGYRLVVNFGDKAGQTVHHIHVHILGGREMKWPPG